MNKTVFFVVVVAAAAVLGGCATPPKPVTVDNLKVKQKHCKTGDCTVVVDAYCDPYDTWKNCTILVDTDFVLVAQGNKPQLIWTLKDPASFAFDKQLPGGTGIMFDPEATDIKGCKLDDARQIVTCKDDHTNKAGEPVIYKYVISLVKKGSPRAVDPLDPWILND